MRPVKHGPNAVQGFPHPRPGTLGDLGTGRLPHGLDVPLGNVGPDRVLENRFQCACIGSMPSSKVSENDTAIMFWRLRQIRLQVL